MSGKQFSIVFTAGEDSNQPDIGVSCSIEPNVWHYNEDTNHTGVTTSHGDGVYSVSSPDPDRILAKLMWDEESDNVRVSFTSRELGQKELYQFTMLADNIRGALKIFQNLCQGACYDPSTSGLVHKSLIAETRGRPVEVIDRGGVAGKIASCFPPEIWHSQSTWFAPNADHTQFGTPYLRWSPVGGVRDNGGEWLLYQVGVTERPIKRANWNDYESIAYLVSECSADPEISLVGRALEDSDLIARSAAKYDLRRKVETAREDFQKKTAQIKPRVTQKIIDDTLQECQYPHRVVRKRTLHDLRPAEVYGWRQRRGDALVPLYAAYSFEFEEAPKPIPAHIQAQAGVSKPKGRYHLIESEKQNFLEKLNAKIVEKNVGTLYLETLNDVVIRCWVAKNTQKFQSNIEAFTGVFENNGDTILPYVNPS